ncbi:Glyoxalase-like domain protein [Pseudovibrio sp. Ad13]|uniref:VOC family protein n=1 Tax=Pseudovibrio sp. Ad13 TaxID=989396 RepID=UPI0007AE6DA3|nr:VOC family protein [Pseudovibrio sp. Ad13]KZK79849.1 Glyoxalase-like domain protein [Pseudovibrio sp. Ad13]
MQLGAFSISLTVKDIKASISFYQKLGFACDPSCDGTDGWAIMKNGETIIGLFQGMFEKNMLTFNPGWDQEAQALDEFLDVRELQKRLKADGIEVHGQEADETTSGPASFTVIDPDGNPILIDQHR